MTVIHSQNVLHITAKHVQKLQNYKLRCATRRFIETNKLKKPNAWNVIISIVVFSQLSKQKSQCKR